MLHWVGIEPVSEHELLHSEEELQMLISDTHHHQGGTNLEKEIVFNAMELRQRLVREVMQPRTEIILLSTDMSLEECLTITEKERTQDIRFAMNRIPTRSLVWFISRNSTPYATVLTAGWI